MILREVAIYLWGNWGKDGACLLSSRCVCTLIERLLDKKVREEKFLKQKNIDAHKFKTSVLKKTNTKDKVIAHYDMYKDTKAKDAVYLLHKKTKSWIDTLTSLSDVIKNFQYRRK